MMLTRSKVAALFLATVSSITVVSWRDTKTPPRVHTMSAITVIGAPSAMPAPASIVQPREP